MIRMVVLAIRFLFVLLLVRIVWRGLARVFAPRATSRGWAPPPSADVLVKDRLCNTYLPRSRSLRAMVGKHEEHFCSAACRDRALAELQRVP